MTVMKHGAKYSNWGCYEHCSDWWQCWVVVFIYLKYQALLRQDYEATVIRKNIYYQWCMAIERLDHKQKCELFIHVDVVYHKKQAV